jgi:hypothetical protein
MLDASPEVIAKLADLVRSASYNAASSHQPAFLDYLKGATEFVTAVAWPSAAVTCVFLFRRQLTNFIGDVDSVKLFGAEISRRINKQIEQSAKEAQQNSGMSSAPSAGELSRAMVVKSLASDSNISLIKEQAEKLAAEYQRVRDSMLPGDNRTRAMEVVVSKMRTIGQAFFPARYEFSNSSSPGKRLMVIAALQVESDYDLLDWLAERVGYEKTFLQYHALVSILIALRGSKASSYLGAIEAAVGKITQLELTFHGDASRVHTLKDIQHALSLLKPAPNS